MKSQWNFQNLECAFIPFSPSLLSLWFTYFMTFTDTLLLRYNTASLGNQSPTVQFSIVVSSSGTDLFKYFLDFFDPQRWGHRTPSYTTVKTWKLYDTLRYIVTMYIVNAMNKYQQCTFPNVMFTLKSAILHVVASHHPQGPYFFKKMKTMKPTLSEVTQSRIKFSVHYVLGTRYHEKIMTVYPPGNPSILAWTWYCSKHLTMKIFINIEIWMYILEI